MSLIARLFYGAVLAAFATIAVAGLWLGALGIAVIAVVLAALFAVTAPFVLGRRWRQPPPPSAYPPRRRRPVRRRR